MWSAANIVAFHKRMMFVMCPVEGFELITHVAVLQRVRSYAGFVQETGNCPQLACRLKGRYDLPNQRLVPSH